MPVRSLDLSVAATREEQQSMTPSLDQQMPPFAAILERVGGMVRPTLITCEIALLFQCDTPEEQDRLITFIQDNKIIKYFFPDFTFELSKHSEIKNTVGVKINYPQYRTIMVSSSQSSSSSCTESNNSLNGKVQAFIFFIERNFSGLVEEFLTRFAKENYGKTPNRISVTLAHIVRWANNELKPLNSFLAAREKRQLNEAEKRDIDETTLSYLKKNSLSILKEMKTVRQDAKPGEIKELSVYDAYMRRLTISAVQIARQANNTYNIGLLMSAFFFHNITPRAYDKEYLANQKALGNINVGNQIPEKKATENINSATSAASSK
jgi:hypothetical protein